MKKILSVILSVIIAAGVSAFSVAVASNNGIKVKETALPAGTWQAVDTFPDVLGHLDYMLADNSMATYKSYHGQGILYVTVNPGVKSFDMFINNKKVSTRRMKAGGTYQVDYGKVARDGSNTLQLTNIQPSTMKNAVVVRAAYPTVMTGTLREAGISKESVKLIDRIVRSDISHGFSSAQIAVVKDGRMVYRNAWGLLNSYNEDLTRRTDGPKVTNDTLYDIASNTKMFSVNYAIQYLVSTGKLSLDTKIVDILGRRFAEDTLPISYTKGDKIPLSENKALKEKVTIRDVLKHRAGFPADPSFHIPDYDQAEQKIRKGARNELYSGVDGSAATRQRTLESICKMPLMYRTNTRTLYSDVDYMLMAFVVEKVTGQGLQSYLKKTFWEPLGLKHITYRPLDNGFTKNDCAATEINGNTRQGAVNFPGIRKRTIQGEVHDGKAYYSMGGVSGHAGLFANATDLAKLFSVMLTGGYGNHRFFSQDVIDEFISPQSESVTDWGTGWYRKGNGSHTRFFSTQAPTTAFGHQGWTGCWTMIDPQTNLVVVYLTNKRNTPVTDPKKSLTEFDGNRFTAGTLGFVPQFLYMGMNTSDKDMRAVIPSLLTDMVNEKHKMVVADGAKSSKDAIAQGEYSLKDVLEKYY